jgi:hypothetical protein
MTKIHEHTLSDLGDRSGRLKCRIDCEGDAIWIGVEGYGDAGTEAGHGFPIKVELYQGELKVLLWGDINDCDPTVNHSMEGARECHRKSNRVAS